MQWHIKFGDWWMIQWHFGGWVSFGIHIDPRKRIHARYHVPYGPYVDIHCLCFIFSIGRNCYLAIDKDINSGRGGVP
jgi:hypothetical protein